MGVKPKCSHSTHTHALALGIVIGQRGANEHDSLEKRKKSREYASGVLHNGILQNRTDHIKKGPKSSIPNRC